MPHPFSWKRRYGDSKRLRAIIGVLYEAGGGVLLSRMRLSTLVPLQCRIHCLFHPPRKRDCIVAMRGEAIELSPEALRLVLEKLGPTFIKLGQVLSLRADIVGESIASEFSKLQSNVPPFPFGMAQKILREELKTDPARVFRTIEPKPVAAASLSQVHRAILKDGTEVAVKVQRPDIRQTISQDIRLLSFLASFLEKHLPEAKNYQPLQVVHEFADWTLRELDFRYEGHNADRFRVMLKDIPAIHIPQIHWEQSSEKVLTMEFIHGTKTDDIAAIHKKHIDIPILVDAAMKAMFRQFFIEGFFHADPHPGNYFALKGNMLCLHDFGMVGYLSEDQRRELLSAFSAFIAQDFDGFTRHFLHLATLSPESDVQNFQKEIMGILGEFFYSKTQPSIALAFFRVLNKGASYRIHFPADLALFAKALVTTEAMGLRLDPSFHFDESLQPYITDAYKQYMMKMAKGIPVDALDALALARQLPEHAQDVLAKIEKGELNVRINTQELDAFKRELDRQNNVRILGTLVVGVLLFSLAIAHLEGMTSIFGFSLWTISVAVLAFLLLWLGWTMRKRRS